MNTCFSFLESDGKRSSIVPRIYGMILSDILTSHLRENESKVGDISKVLAALECALLQKHSDSQVKHSQAHDTEMTRNQRICDQILACDSDSVRSLGYAQESSESLFLHAIHNIERVERGCNIYLRKSSSSNANNHSMQDKRVSPSIHMSPQLNQNKVQAQNAIEVDVDHDDTEEITSLPVKAQQGPSNEYRKSSRATLPVDSITSAIWARPGTSSNNATVKPAGYIPETVVGVAPLKYKNDGSVIRAGVRGQTMLTFDVTAYQPVAAVKRPTAGTTAALPVLSNCRGQQTITSFTENIASAKRTGGEPTGSLAVAPPEGASTSRCASQEMFSQSRHGELRVVKLTGCTVRTAADMDASLRLGVIAVGTVVAYNHVVHIPGCEAEGVLPTTRFRAILPVSQLRSWQSARPDVVDVPLTGPNLVSTELQWADPNKTVIYGWVSASGRLTTDNAPICEVLTPYSAPGINQPSTFFADSDNTNSEEHQVHKKRKESTARVPLQQLNSHYM